MRFAMVLNGRVIEVIEAEIAPAWPPDQEKNRVIAVECDETVNKGMIYSEENGEFEEYVYPPAHHSGTVKILQAVQVSEELKLFYDEIVKEVGL